MVICLERGADLHMAQLVPLPLTVTCFSKIQIGFTFLVPAHLGSLGQRAPLNVCVCVCVCVYLLILRSLRARRRQSMVGESTAGGGGGGGGAGAGRRRTSYASRVFLGLSAVVGVQSTGNHRVGVGRRRVTLACVPGGRGRVRRLLAAATRAPAPSLYHHMGICFFSRRAPAPSLDPTRAFASLTPYTGMCSFSIPPHGHLLH